MPVGDLSRENARHECGTLWCVRGTVVRTLGSVGSTLHSHRSCFTFARACVCLHCMCTCACSRTAFVRRQHTHVPRRRVRVFAGKERTTEGQGAIGRSKGDGEIRRRQVNGGRKREIMPRREDGWIIRATDGRKLEGQRGTARRWIDDERNREREREKKSRVRWTRTIQDGWQWWCRRSLRIFVSSSPFFFFFWWAITRTRYYGISNRRAIRISVKRISFFFSFFCHRDTRSVIGCLTLVHLRHRLQAVLCLAGCRNNG